MLHFFLVYTKDKYHEDVDAKIKLYENFIAKYPKSMFKGIAAMRITELKKEKFLKTD